MSIYILEPRRVLALRLVLSRLCYYFGRCSLKYEWKNMIFSAVKFSSVNPEFY